MVGNHGARGSAIVRIEGNAAGQTITGNANLSFGIRTVPYLVIDAGTNPVTLSGYLGVWASYIHLSSGAFTTSGSTLAIVDDSSGFGVNTIRPGTVSYNNVEIQSENRTWDLNGETMDVSGQFRLLQQHSSGTYRELNNGTVEVGGDLRVETLSGGNGRGLRGNALIKLVGNASGQLIYGSANTHANLPRLEIDAGANNLTMTRNLSVNNSYRVTSVGSFTHTGALYLRCLDSAAPCDNSGGTFDLNFGTATNYRTLRFVGNAAIFDLGGASLTLSRDLDLLGASTGVFINNGSISVGENLAIQNFGMNGSLQLSFTGSTPTLITNPSSGQVPDGDWAINKTAGASVSLQAAIDLNDTNQNLTFTAGQLDLNGFNLNVEGTLTLESGTSITTGLGSLSYGTLVNNGGTIGP